MEVIVSTVHILSSLLLIGLILIQQGKGADVGATLGGDSSSLFGPTADNPLRNMTTIIAVVFMVTSVTLAYYARYGASSGETKLFSDTPTSVSEPVEATSETAASETQDTKELANEAAPEVPEADTVPTAKTNEATPQ